MGFPHRGLGLKPSKEKGRGGGGGLGWRRAIP